MAKERIPKPEAKEDMDKTRILELAMEDEKLAHWLNSVDEEWLVYPERLRRLAGPTVRFQHACQVVVEEEKTPPTPGNQ